MKPVLTLISDAVRLFLLAAIRLYQWTLSPFFGPCCRYSPSCSHYGAEAVGRFGAWRGGWLTVKRVLRCNPWGAAGDDPVPQTWPSPKSPAPANARRAVTVERTRA